MNTTTILDQWEEHFCFLNGNVLTLLFFYYYYFKILYDLKEKRMQIFFFLSNLKGYTTSKLNKNI